MSTISVSNIETANGSEPLTVKTGNTSGPTIVLYTNGTITFTANTVSGIETGISTGKAIAMAIVFG